MNVLARTRVGASVGLDFTVAPPPKIIVPMPPAAAPPAPPKPLITISPDFSPTSTVVLLGKEVSCGEKKSANPTHSAIDDSFEKFADPIWNCIGEGVAGDWSHRLAYSPMKAWPGVLSRLGLSAVGTEYLAKVPNRAGARVAAMREKITRHTGKNPAVLQMREASQTAIRKMALDLVSLYKNPARSEELVEKYRDLYHRSVREIGDDLKKIERIIAMSPPELQAQLRGLLKNVEPMIAEMKRGVSEFADKVVGSTAGASSGILSSLGPAVPIASAVFSAASSIYEMAKAQIKAEEDARKKVCTVSLQEAIELQKYTMDLGMPFPWHAIEFGAHVGGPFYNACETATDPFGLDPWPVQAFSAAIYNNLVRLYCLPLDMQRDVIKWWSHANAMMADADVARVFDALGGDALGGLLASDEQVMLVAAPIAAANGLSIDDFAVALWNKSRGWPARKGLLRRQGDKRVAATDLDDAKLKWEILDGVCMIDNPDNAMQIQWGILAADAFALLDEVKKTGKIPVAYLTGRSAGDAYKRGGGIPGRSPAGGETMRGWSDASPEEKAKGGLGALAIVGGVILGGIMLLRGGHA